MSNPFGSDGGPLPNPYSPATSSLDGISVAALVCSLSCCAAPVAIGLGIAGIVRTGGDRRTGRWMAVTGLVLGIVVSLALVVGAVAVARWLEEADLADEEEASGEPLQVDQLRAGDCVGMVIEDYKYIDITSAECTEPHEAEIVYASHFTSPQQVQAHLDDPTFCWPLGKTFGYTTLLDDGEYGYDVVVDSARGARPAVGDAFACFVRPIDQTPMDTPLPRGEPEPAPEASGPRRVSSLDLDIGDCFDEPVEGAEDLVDEVVVKGCSRPHTYEVIGLVEIRTKDFPGDRAIERRSDACLDRFRDYLGIAYADSRFELNYYSPTRDSWRHDDDHTITCLGLHPQEKKLGRSLEGIAR